MMLRARSGVTPTPYQALKVAEKFGPHYASMNPPRPANSGRGGVSGRG